MCHLRSEEVQWAARVCPAHRSYINARLSGLRFPDKFFVLCLDLRRPFFTFLEGLWDVGWCAFKRKKWTNTFPFLFTFFFLLVFGAIRFERFLEDVYLRGTIRKHAPFTCCSEGDDIGRFLSRNYENLQRGRLVVSKPSLLLSSNLEIRQPSLAISYSRIQHLRGFFVVPLLKIRIPKKENTVNYGEIT